MRTLRSVRLGVAAHSGSLWDLSTLIVGLVPGLIVAWMFLSSPIVPPGGDPAHHALFVRDILRSQTSFIPYTQFPRGGAPYEYPPLFDLAVALLVGVSRQPILPTMETFVVALSFLSPFAYWRFLRRFYRGGASEAFLGILFVAFDWFLLLKTVRDGSYGDLMAAGVLLPGWLALVWDHRDFLAAGMAFAIILTHNLTALLTLGVLAGLVLLWIFEKQWGRVRAAILAHAIVLVPTAAVVPSVYVSYIAPVSSGTAGVFQPIDLPSYVVLLTPILVALAVLGIFILRRTFEGRLTGLWILSWFALSRTSFASERIVREMIFPLAVGAAGFAIAVRRRWMTSAPAGPNRTAILLVAAIVGIAMVNGSIQLSESADPSTVHYITSYQLTAYDWLANHTAAPDAVLSISSADPYLPVFFPGDVFGVISYNRSVTLSAPDRAVNDALVAALLDYQNASGAALLRSYGIRWILLSSPFPPPTFTDPYDMLLIEKVYAEPLVLNPDYASRFYVASGSGSTRIYEVLPGGLS